MQRTIAMYRAAERREELEHKADSNGEEKVDGDAFDRALASRLAPLDESTLIARSNSDIVLRRSKSGDPLPLSLSSPQPKRTRSSRALTDGGSSASSSSSSPSLRPSSSSQQGPSSSSSSSSPSRRPQHQQQQQQGQQPPRRGVSISPECLRAISLLPPVRVDLRSRSGTSLSLVWDSDMEALICLRKVLDSAGVAIAPRYEVTYRAAQQKTDFEAAAALHDCSLHMQEGNKAAKWRWLPLEDQSATSGTIEGLEPNTQYSVRCRRMQASVIV